MTRQLAALIVALAIGSAAIYTPSQAADGQNDPQQIYEALYELGMCESGGDYTLNTGNGFYGKYQFSLSTWRSVGGGGFPHMAPPEEQDARAWYLLTHYGPQHWPYCGRFVQS